LLRINSNDDDHRDSISFNTFFAVFWAHSVSTLGINPWIKHLNAPNMKIIVNYQAPKR